MSTGKPPAKGPNILGAFVDFLILVLLVGGSGLGGYWWGTVQRLAPVKDVPAGTSGAIPANLLADSGLADSAKSGSAKSSSSQTDAGKTGQDSADSGKSEADKAAADKSSSAKTDASKTSQAKSKDTSAGSAKKGKVKYWITSSGTDYIGYSITVKVNGTAVDNFFGPGKTIDISRLVKSGENSVAFEAKALESGYNKHKGDSNSELVLKVVSGPTLQEDFDDSAVLVTYRRNASESESFNDTEHFLKD